MTVGEVGSSADATWLVEHRLRAVLEVRNGSPVTEIAARYGASRQSVYGWKTRYERDGIGGLADRSRRPHTSPARMPAQVEALVCELRRAHPRWGARRVVFELDRQGVGPVPSRATVHRALVRNGLVEPQEQRHRRKYKRWQREAPMHLWQMDLVGGIYLADGRECKMVTGIDDHSRYVVIVAVVAVPNGRAVCDALTAAMGDYGIPSEVLTDNGKQFTGRFTKPRPAEVMFERICRENGITARLTKPRSPTSTGKIERWHKTLRRELLDQCGPFADLPGGAGGDRCVGAHLQPRPAASVPGHGHPGQPVPPDPPQHQQRARVDRGWRRWQRWCPPSGPCRGSGRSGNWGRGGGEAARFSASGDRAGEQQRGRVRHRENRGPAACSASFPASNASG